MFAATATVVFSALLITALFILDLNEGASMVVIAIASIALAFILTPAILPVGAIAFFVAISFMYLVFAMAL